jgi:hypothetical protein
MYKKFLADAPPDDPDRAQAAQILSELERQIAARPPPPAEAPAAPPAPAPGAPQVVASAPEPSLRKPFIARHWWIIPASAAVAAGVTVGIYFGVAGSGCPASVGCVVLMGAR